jgi:hypothetical protein
MLPIATKEYFESLKRFNKHLPPGKDEELLILKGHLAIERLLEGYLESRLPNPSALDSEEMSFGRKLSLAKALSSDAGDEWLWATIHTLNKLRNELAHELESVKFANLFQDFIGKAEANPELPELDPPREVTQRLHRALFLIHEAMSHRVDL